MEHFAPLVPSPEQAKNNPNKYWESFLSQKVKALEKILSSGTDAVRSAEAAAAEALKEVPENKRDFVNAEELLLRAFELYAQTNGGFSDEGMKKAYLSRLAPFLAEKLRNEEYDTVENRFRSEIVDLKNRETFLSDDDVPVLRDAFYEKFGALKANEYPGTAEDGVGE